MKAAILTKKILPICLKIIILNIDTNAIKMDASTSNFKEERRQFLSKFLPAGMLSCMCCPKLLATSTNTLDKQDDQEKGKCE